MNQSPVCKNNNLDGRCGSNHYAKFINTLPWTHFGTFTTKHILSLNATRRLANGIAFRIPNQRNSIKMFWVAEQFKSGDGYHLHCLINCSEQLFIYQIKNWYENTHGFCRILPKNDRASSYLIKNLRHPLSDYGVI